MAREYKVRDGGVIRGPITITIDGPQASGKTVIAREIETMLMKRGIPVIIHNHPARGVRDEERFKQDRADHPVVIKDLQ